MPIKNNDIKALPNIIIAKISPIMIIVGLLAAFMILVSDGISFKWLVSFFGLIFIFFYNKIELNNGNLIIKSLLSPFITGGFFPQIYFNKTINLNNIISIKFSPYFLFFLGFSMTDSITIYYTTLKNKKSSFTIPLFVYPGFRDIIDEILKIKPDIKTNKKLS